MSEFFNVVFAGQMAAGSDPATVRVNVGRLFKVTNEATLDKLFSGQRIAVKKAVSQADAMKLRALLKQAGAVATLEACDEQGKPLAAATPAVAQPAPQAPASAPPPKPASAPVAPAAPAVKPAAPAMPAAANAPAPATAPAKPVAPAAPAQPAKPMTMAERIAAMAAADTASNAAKAAQAAAAAPATAGGNWNVAPVGATLAQANPNAPAPVQPDISAISMARPGGELLKAEERAQLAPAPVVVPDLSAIKVAPPNSEVLRAEERAVVVPVAVDISSLSMAPPNTEVLKEDEKTVVIPVEVDLTGMAVAPVGADLEEIREVKVPVNPDTSKLKLA